MQATQTAPVKPAVYQAPQVRVGDIVMCYPSVEPGEPGLPALVTKAGARSLSVNIFSDQWSNMALKDGVRHKSDPSILTNPPHPGEDWIWDFTPQARELALMRKRLEELLLALGEKGK